MSELHEGKGLCIILFQSPFRSCKQGLFISKHEIEGCYYRPIPGKVKLLLISGKKSASLYDHISRFYKSSVCYLVLEKYFQNKNCEAFLSLHE